MNIKKLSDIAIIPDKGSSGAAGYDLYTTETYELSVGERRLFKTDIAMAIPFGSYGRIAPRSGLAVKKGLDVLAGVIDSDYRGEIMVALINLGQEPIQIKSGDKIAQIIFQSHYLHKFVEVYDLDSTDRASKGFGSTDETVQQNYKHSVLSDIYKTHPIEVNSKTKYSDLMKEREKSI